MSLQIHCFGDHGDIEKAATDLYMFTLTKSFSFDKQIYNLYTNIENDDIMNAAVHFLVCSCLL